MESELLKGVRRLSQHYAFNSIQMHEAVARKAGLSGTDHKYLGFIIEKGQMTAGELSRLTGLTTGAVTGLIDRFEKKNLVRRKLVANDRRKVIIEPITENIMSLLVPLYATFREKSATLMASFSEDQIKTIEAYFSGAIEIMKDVTTALNESTHNQSNAR
ncbi:DNA-binding MarR family transcriptional regulator [Larkinella arboricola]|uniref:DNA-binding MarR family transcriptional regulator n=1 Tax=Larkinella arboricola TaxID=643671 RepID=A0A327WH01_LARAB|nr:MarR family transcriptional regulator [Larkinella arboricola]RAJ89871.1 DNA-binding MarR family transcriptional regulator [Larkinella arboricola]